MERIILTADNTLMSNYRHNEFVGFGACAPPNVIPDFLYKWMFFPPIRPENGKQAAAPYGLRKIEAQLVKEGFNVVTVPPNELSKHVENAKVLGIHVMDPFGLGPASSTFACILKKEPYLAQYFRQLLNHPAIGRAKKRGLKIIVGGPGAWQFQYRPEFVEKYGIDSVIEGEAENVVGKIFRTAIEGQELAKRYETSIRETPTLDEIPNIIGPSVNGLVEIGRGCCRGCKFCSVTERPLRWYPLQKILQEIEVNLSQGVEGVILHTDDVMLYGSRNTLPNDEKLLELHEIAAKKCKGITWSHCSLAAVAAKPQLFSKISETICQRQPWWGVEIGIETGSPELIEKVMPAKAHPFKPKEWPEVVRTGMGLMHDHKLIPAGTLIVGVPEETEADLSKTLELLDDLKNIRSMIVPLFFVPMGRLKNENWFKETKLTKLHSEVLIKCMEHDFRWIEKLIDLSFSGQWQAGLIRPFYRFFVQMVKIKARRSGLNVK